MRVVLFGVLFVWQAASQPPDTEIFLASLSVRDGKVEIGKPINISNSPGYDNQPSFTPDGAAVLFTSVRGDRKARSGQQRRHRQRHLSVRHRAARGSVR